MKQAEIWLINLDLAFGSEIKKTRPALIVSDDSIGRLPLKVIVPFTDWKDHYQIAPWMIKISPDRQNGLSKNSAADCFQVRSISEKQFVNRMGYANESTLEYLKEGLAKVYCQLRIKSTRLHHS